MVFQIGFMVFKVFGWFPWFFKVASWFFMVFGWFPWFFKLVSWFFMVFGWFPWFFKVVSWFLLGFHGFSRWFHGFCLVSMVFKVSRWIFIVINGPRLVKSELSAAGAK